MLKSEGRPSRVYMWSCTMTGIQNLEAYHHAHDAKPLQLFEDGLIATFMAGKQYHAMEPRNDLAGADTKWVLANPGTSYIAYSYDCNEAMGLKQLADGVYKLEWMDCVTGRTHTEYNVPVGWGEH